MGVQGDAIFVAVAERGFPEPWLEFGDRLCWEAVHSTHAKHAIDIARADGHASAGGVHDALARKRDNLEHAAKLLDDVLVDYDRTGEWPRLDERAIRLDIADVSERWARGLVAHPFPITLKSLQFNWGYMKEHGVRAFYEMTRDYIADLLANTDRWQAAWDTEIRTGMVDRLTTIECDLASIEAPMHCDVCKKTISTVMYLPD